MMSLAVESMTPEQMAAELKSLRKTLANIEESRRVKELKHEVELLQDENAQLREVVKKQDARLYELQRERKKAYLDKSEVIKIYAINANHSKKDYQIELSVCKNIAVVNPTPVIREAAQAQ